MKLKLPNPWFIVYTCGSIKGPRREMFPLACDEAAKQEAIASFNALTANWARSGCYGFRLVNLNSVNFAVEAVFAIPDDELPVKREDAT